jgi:hypothetical protein
MVRPRPSILFRSETHQRDGEAAAGMTCGARGPGYQSADGSCIHGASRMYPVTVSSRSTAVDATNGCTSGTAAPQTIIAIGTAVATHLVTRAQRGWASGP